MRSDMSKVVTERPRTNRGWTYGNFRSRMNRGDLDDLPSKQGMRRPYRHNGDDFARDFTDLINPLYRYLHSCVGRPWNDVWSEICANLRPDSTTQQHIRDHVTSYVEMHAVYDPVTNKVYEACHGSFVTAKKYRGEIVGLYVDPHTGILKNNDHYNYNDWRNQFEPKLAEVYRNFGKELEAYKISGIWYWVVFKTVPGPFYQKIWDPVKEECVMLTQVIHQRDNEVFNLEYVHVGNYRVVTNYRFTHLNLKNHKSGERYKASKKQVCSNDLKKYKLKND